MIRISPRVLCPVLLSVIACSSMGLAAQVNASQIASVEHDHLLKQKFVRDCSDTSNVLRWQNSDIRVTEKGDVQVIGQDYAGHTFTAIKGTGVFGCSLWEADLNGDGSKDLLILVPGQDSSGGYDTELSILFFDKTGVPFPWKAAGKFTAGAKGVEQLLAGPKPPAASIVVPTKEGIQGPEDVSYSFQLYAFSSAGAEKVNGDAFNLTWPVYINQTPALVQHQERASLAFSNAAAPQFRRIQPASSIGKVRANSAIGLDGGTTFVPPAILVRESNSGDRTILFDPLLSDLESLKNSGSAVATFGQSCEEEECRPMVAISKP